MNFHKQRAITTESLCDMDHYRLEDDIMVLNNVTKFHKIMIKSIRFRERTSSGQTYVRKVQTDGQGPSHYHGGGIKTDENSNKSRPVTHPEFSTLNLEVPGSSFA